jgi:hypothetical protein
MVESFGANRQKVQKSAVPMPNPVNSKDTSNFFTCELD